MLAQLKTYGTLLLVAALLIALGVQSWRLRSAQAAEDELATDQIISELEGRGFEVVTAEEAKNVRELLEENDLLSDSLQSMGTVVEDLRARMAIVTRVEATAGGETEVEAVAHAPDTGNAREEMTETGERVIPDSITAHVEDGPLTATIMCRLFPARCRLGWTILITGSLLHVQGPDGRLIVTAEADDPRVSLRIPSLQWVPPEEDVGFPWGETLVGCGAGLGTAAVDAWLNDGFRLELPIAGCLTGAGVGAVKRLWPG